MSEIVVGPWHLHVRRGAKRVIIAIEWLFWIVFFAFAITLLALRFVVLPNIESYRPRIEAGLTRVLGAPVSIGAIRAGWQGLHPELDLAEVKVLDGTGRPALVLPAVSVAVSWWSVPRNDLRLHALDISGADLDIRRQADGKLLIGGIEIKSSGEGSSDWILGQRRIAIHNSRLRWNDEKRGAPELALENISVVIENWGDRHRFGLTADPPRALASRLDVRADLHGATLNELRAWNGEVYANLAYIDLAAWRAWLDYPADVQAGAGGVRAWAGFKGDRLDHFTADVSLSNAAVRLRQDLPVLELARVSGRMGAREIASGGLGFGFLRFGDKKVTGFEVSGKQVALATPGGVALAPADFSVKTTAGVGNEPQQVDIQANSMDLEPLARLVEHLPLDADLRKALAQYNPRGSIYDFRLNWAGDFSKPKSYTARGRFFNVAMDALEKQPGFSGLSGSVDATEKGGTLYVASKATSVVLPGVFEDPKIDLDTLNLQAKWTFPNDRLQVSLDNAAFSNADLTGTASGTWRAEPGTSGYIDLQGKLTHAEAKRVWRYMPLSTAAQTRTWLKNAMDEGGVSDDTRLILRGNLRDFPFMNPQQGLFRVNVKVRDINLLYSEGWPRIDKLKGDLLFERNFMEIRGQSGTMRETKLGRVDVRIPDLNGRPHILEVQGSAEGTTAAFLDFIAASPVDRYIDGFTQTMRGTGNAKLTLKMTLPIEESVKVKVNGEYQFINTELKLDEGLPQLSKVNGVLGFNEKGILLKNLRGEALGGPFTLTGGSRGEGLIALAASGNFTAPGLRTWLTEPFFARISGGAPWRAAINIRNKKADVTVDSTLAGAGIDLPAPLTKAPADILALKVVKSNLPARGEDELAITLGNVANMRLQRRPEGDNMVLARGAVGVGDALPAMPRAGLALNLAAVRVDVDDWKRKLLEAPPAAATPAVTPVAAAPAPARPPASPVPPAAAPAPPKPANTGLSNLGVANLNLRTDSLSGFGRTMHDVKLSGGQDSGAWGLNLVSREVTGDINFRLGAQGAPGKLTARLKNLVIPASDAQQVDNALDRASDELPAIDLVAENFEAGDKKFGKLTLQAENQGGEWALQKVSLENPDGVLNGSGAWRVRQNAQARRRIDLKFELDARDAGKLLDRLGFAATLRRGAGKLEGSVGWDGSPLSIDYPSLRGNLALSVKSGQFLKADPGVGKLLGIMSLQALPRRLIGDFRDVFSEGFAFDEVSASSKIERGVLSTTDFKMTSPAAVVLMSGDVDLVKESQKLRLVVLPDLSGGVSSVVAAAIGAVNPIVALGSIVVQRLFKDPLAKAFSFEYEVSGTWADPKVARVQTPRPGAGEPAQGAAPGAAQGATQGAAPGTMPGAGTPSAQNAAGGG